MEDYELVVLYHPDLEIDLDKALKKVEGVISNAKGKVVESDNWGKRKLAYTIKKEDHAIYVVYKLELPKDSVAKVESTLNITDEVLRYLLVKPDPRAEEESKEEKDEKEESSTDEK